MYIGGKLLTLHSAQLQGLRDIGMLEPSSVIFSTQQTDPANEPAEVEGQAVRQRKKKGSLAVELDPYLVPRLAPGQPGRPKGSANYEWSPEADNTLIDLCKRLGPTRAKPIMQRKLLELGIADPEARPDTIRKAVEYRMAKLNLPTGQARKAPAGRIAKRWTEAQTAALLGALGADATIESVAARTGHSVKSVHAKLARLDYSVHEIAGFAIFTVDQISTLLNVTPRQIRRWKEKGWLQTKDRRITERDLGEFLREHADGIDYESLNRETQIYLVDLGYPGAERVEFRKNVRQILDGVGRQRKHRRNVRTGSEGADGDAANDASSDEPASETSLSAAQSASE